MSGGVGPCDDIGLTKEAQIEDENSLQKNETKPYPTSNSKSKVSLLRRGFHSLRQLNALAVVVVLAASGMVAVGDIAFVVFTFIYMYFMSKIAFPNLSLPGENAAVFSETQNKILRIYVFVAFLVGIFFPILYIFEGIFEGDKEGIKAAAPHVFLLASQVFMEGVVFSSRFSLPIRVLVPVIYNSMRIFTIMEWVTSEISKVDEEFGGSAGRLYVGRVLAVANLALWTFNLLGFLLPFYLPMAFKKYYGASKVKD